MRWFFKRRTKVREVCRHEAEYLGWCPDCGHDRVQELLDKGAI